MKPSRLMKYPSATMWFCPSCLNMRSTGSMGLTAMSTTSRSALKLSGPYLLKMIRVGRKVPNRSLVSLATRNSSRAANTWRSLS